MVQEMRQTQPPHNGADGQKVWETPLLESHQVKDGVQGTNTIFGNDVLSLLLTS